MKSDQRTDNIDWSSSDEPCFGHHDTDTTCPQCEDLTQQVIEDARSLAMLYHVTATVNHADSVEQAVHVTLERVCRHFGWSFGHALFPAETNGKQLHVALSFDAMAEVPEAEFCRESKSMRFALGEGLPGRVFQSRSAEWVEDTATELSEQRAGLAERCGLRTAAAFPVLIGDEVVAVIEVFSDQAIDASESSLELLTSIGMQLGRAVERKRFEKQLADATAREQRWFGLELHDGVAQQLVGIGMLAEQLRQGLDSQGSSWESRAARLVELVNETQRQVHSLSRGLLPVEIDAHGLMAALEGLAESTCEFSGIRCEFHCRRPVRFEDNMTATQLYRIVQEAIQNAIKHANAQRIVISLHANGSTVWLSIVDDGIGMDGVNSAKGMGIRTMRYRAGLIGANLKVESRSGQGTSVVCQLADLLG